jgi:hypothetical protein
MPVINLCRKGNRSRWPLHVMKKVAAAIWHIPANQSMSSASSTRTTGGMYGYSNDHQPPGCASSPLGLTGFALFLYGTLAHDRPLSGRTRLVCKIELFSGY